MSGDERLRPKEQRLIEAITRGMAPEIRQYIIDALQPLQTKIAELEVRVGETPKFVGPWREKTVYQRASLVSFRGGLWHANSPTEARPGTDPSWTLAVKRGRGEIDQPEATERRFPTQPRARSTNAS